MKRILIIDGQGGGMGAQLAKLLLPKLPADCELLAVGTNVLATSAMLKAGAVRGATGENAVVYNAARADVILGPIGILMANGIMGEVSPKMSVAISGSEAAKVLIPACPKRRSTDSCSKPKSPTRRSRRSATSCG